MKRNPFTKRINGIGPGPGEMAQARIRALATISRQAEQELAKKDFERSNRERANSSAGNQPESIPEAPPESEEQEPMSGSKSVERWILFRWAERIWALRN